MRILVVDDELSIRTLVEALLTGAGYDVSTAANGKAAMAILSESRFDVLLSDIRMPEMDGNELAQWAAVHHPETRTILMTGYDPAQALTELSQRTIVSKPFVPRDLLALIAQTVSCTTSA